MTISQSGERVESDSRLTWSVFGALLVSIDAGVVFSLISLHYVYTGSLPWFTVIFTTVGGFALAGPWKRIIPRLHLLVRILGVAVLAVMVWLNTLSGVQRHDQQAPARAIAAQQAAVRASAAASIASVNAVYQSQLNQATTAATNQLATQGFVSDFSGDPPDVTLSNLTSGTVTIYIAVGYARFQPVVPIEKINGRWVAGCPTTAPGVMYPLDGPNNQVAISLNDSGHCPAGIAPPSSRAPPQG